MKPLPEILQNSYNQKTLEFFQAGSCHSDPAIATDEALQGTEGVEHWTMGDWAYASLFWYYRQCIFAYGEGMQYIWVRLQSGTAKKYLSSGHIQPDKCPDWYYMEPPWGNDAFQEVLLAAYSEAVSASEKLSQQ